MAAMIKHLSGHLDTELIVFSRNLIGLCFLLPWLINAGGFPALKTRVFGLHALRGLSGVSAMVCFFYTIGHMPLADAVVVKMTVPFFLPLVAWLWLSERITVHNLIAIAMGFAGVAVMMQIGSGSINPVFAVALLGAALMSIAKVSIRRMAGSEPAGRVIFYFGLFATLFSSLLLPFVDTWPSTTDLLWLIAIGLVATFGQFALTTAYQIAKPGQVGVYNYSAVIWAASLGWIIWGETFTLATLIGTLLIVSAGFWNLITRR